MKLFNVTTIAIAAVLLAGCIHESKQKTYLLDAPAINLSETFYLENVKLPEYLSSTQMRYVTTEGTLEEVKDGAWAIPLDRLIRDILREAISNSTGAKYSSACTITIKQIRLSENDTLEFSGHISRNMHDNRARDPQNQFVVEVSIELDKKKMILPDAFRKAITKALGKIIQTKVPVEAAY